MTSPIVLAIIGALATVGAGTGVYQLLTVRATKAKLIADAKLSEANTAALLSQSAREWLQSMEQRLHQAEAEADAARRSAQAAAAETTAALGQVRQLRAELADLTSIVRRVRAAILAPDASLERLRMLVTSDYWPDRGSGGERNGRP